METLVNRLITAAKQGKLQRTVMESFMPENTDFENQLLSMAVANMNGTIQVFNIWNDMFCGVSASIVDTDVRYLFTVISKSKTSVSELITRAIEISTIAAIFLVADPHLLQVKYNATCGTIEVNIEGDSF